jgi:hypothetical protein
VTDPALGPWSWHDNLIRGLAFAVGDPEAGDWRCDLVLDIEHIVEWLCDQAGGARFRVAPATLVFHDVSDLAIALDFADGSHPQTLNELSIAAVSCEPLLDHPMARAGPYFRWRIALNLPPHGEIAFGASGFTQTLRDEPALVDQPRLPRERRPVAG